MSDAGPIAETVAWRKLTELGARFGDLDLRRLFADDPRRAERMTFEIGDLAVDCSKHLVDDEILAALLALACVRGVAERAAETAAGEPVNTTENRPALHTALRAPADSVIDVDGRDVVPEVQRTLGRMGDFCDRVRSGEHTGATGKPFETVVNIGIGGSDLGPSMAYDALAGWRHPRLRCEFVANVDAADLSGALAGLDAETTLLMLSSKTFTTAETMLNARSARRWLVERLGADAVGQHFVAASADTTAAEAFGIGPDNVFPIWDWVGGRFSVGSAIGLSLMLAIGRDAFTEMLAGFRTVDAHFLSAPPERNVPLLLGLLAVWYRTFCDLPARAVLPYAHNLRGLPAYLRQLDMESNGKRVDLGGEPLSWHIGPILFGEPGTKGQHSFHQFLHQGTTVVPADFIVMARPDAVLRDFPEAEAHHAQLVANCLAQSAALAFGNAPDPAPSSAPDPHRELPGNRPSTTILAPALTPSVLGQLIALYEHQVLAQGTIWGINSFDQWGVELGKTLAVGIAADLADPPPVASPTADTAAGHSDPPAGACASEGGPQSPAAESGAGHDPSTTALVARCRALRRARSGQTPD